MKKIIVSLILIFALCQPVAFAEETAFQQIPVETSFVPLGGASLSEGVAIPSEATDYPAFFGNFTFEEYLCAFITESETLPTFIDGLEQFGINNEEFDDVYFDIALKHSELFLKTGYTNLEYNKETGAVQSFVPKYLVSSVEEAEEGRKILAAGIKEYTDAAEKYSTPLEKLLVIHDKMVADCDYDMNAMNVDTKDLVPDTARHAIGVFRDKVAVCQGYSQALYIIAKELDIEMDFCYSEEKNHMWNYVKLNGKWYHLDLTNDDPAGTDENGALIARKDPRAYHMYFMVSDAGLKEAVHGTDYSSFGNGKLPCNDSSYEKKHLFNIGIPFTANHGDDGFYRVEVNLELTNYGITIPVTFKNENLRIGAAASALCPVLSNSGTDLYLVSYPTEDIEKATIINRYDNKNSMSRADNVKLPEDTFDIRRIAKQIPSNMGIGFTSFIWETQTLVPCAEKAVWSQN